MTRVITVALVSAALCACGQDAGAIVPISEPSDPGVTSVSPLLQPPPLPGTNPADGVTDHAIAHINEDTSALAKGEYLILMEIAHAITVQINGVLHHVSAH